MRRDNNLAEPEGFPYRIALAGGWIDLPWVSSICPGAMVVASLQPTLEFNDRSGMATSSRKTAIELWGNRLPPGDPVRMAELLFGAENPPGCAYVSGSQDQIGLLVPGISRLFYAGNYWPENIESTVDPALCDWLSHVLYLLPLPPRPSGYDPLLEKYLDYEWIKKLGESGDACWTSILNQDAAGLGRSLVESLECWRNILPGTVTTSSLKEIERFAKYPGATFSGCGGGYIIVVSEREIPGALQVQVRS